MLVSRANQRPSRLEEAPVADARERAGRVLARVVIGELGQAQRQLGLVDRERLVIANRVRGPSPRVAGRVSELDRKVDRDGLAPVALTREDPVAQPVADRAAAAAERLESADDRAFGCGRRQAVELAAADVDAVVDVRGLERVVQSPVRAHDLDDRKTEGGRELEVALVVPGDGHDGAGAVAAKHVVSHPDRQASSGDRVDGHGACRHTGLRLGERDTVQLALAGSRLDVCDDGLAPSRRRQRARQLVLGREHDVGRAHEGIGPRREDGDARVRVTVDTEDDLGALRTADPAALRGERPLGPVDERQVLGEPIGIGGDPQHPLSERRAIDGMAAALALAVDDFLVGEHGAERGTPVDGHRRLVREPAPEQLQEDPLRPAYVARIGGVDLARPVVAEAEHLELALERRDVVRRRPRGMLPGLDRVLLGRQAERVPAHRVQHVVAAHAPGARHDVGGGVPLGMTDVQADAGRVGEHVEDVALGPAAPARGAERPVLVPVALPAGLDLEVVVGHVLLYPARVAPRSALPTGSRAASRAGPGRGSHAPARRRDRPERH